MGSLLDISNTIRGADRFEHDYYNYSYYDYYRAYHVGDPFASHKPVHGGVAIRMKSGQATVGGLVRKGNTVYLVSNKHVFADKGLNDEQVVHSLKNAKVTKSTDVKDTTGRTIGKTVVGMTSTSLDVAFAKPTVPVSWDIPYIGIPTGTVAPQVGMKITKIGVTTGQSFGTIGLINPTTVGPNSWCAYSDTPLADKGDSGALVFEAGTRRVVGINSGSGKSGNSYLVCGFSAPVIERTFGVSFTPPGMPVLNPQPAPISPPPLGTKIPSVPSGGIRTGDGLGLGGLGLGLPESITIGGYTVPTLAVGLGGLVLLYLLSRGR